MDFRIINDETLPKIMELWDYCFEKNDTPFFKWYFNEYCLKENMVLGGFDEKSGNLMNMLHLNPYTINLRGRDLKLPYIVGVATAPEYRADIYLLRFWKLLFRFYGLRVRHLFY